MIRSTLTFCAVAVATMAWTLDAHAAGLSGSTADVAVYCCTAPVPADLVSNVATATVTNAVEFPVGSLHGGSVIPVSIDVGDTFIDITYTAAAQAAGGTFNGYVFNFTGAAPIVSVTLDPVGTITPVGVSFTSDSVSVNMASRTLASGSTFRLDVNTAPVPEPATVPLMLAGLAALAALARSRRRS